MILLHVLSCFILLISAFHFATDAYHYVVVGEWGNSLLYSLFTLLMLYLAIQCLRGIKKNARLYKGEGQCEYLIHKALYAEELFALIFLAIGSFSGVINIILYRALMCSIAVLLIWIPWKFFRCPHCRKRLWPTSQKNRMSLSFPEQCPHCGVPLVEDERAVPPPGV